MITTIARNKGTCSPPMSEIRRRREAIARRIAIEKNIFLEGLPVLSGVYSLIYYSANILRIPSKMRKPKLIINEISPVFLASLALYVLRPNSATNKEIQ